VYGNINELQIICLAEVIIYAGDHCLDRLDPTFDWSDMDGNKINDPRFDCGGIL